MHESALDALAEELGKVAGRIEREAELRITAALADLRRAEAERELRLSALERVVADRLALVRDGKDADPKLIERMVADAVAKLPPALPGKDADPAEIAALVGAEVASAVAALPPAAAGKDADTAVIERMVAEAVGALPVPAPGKDADPALIERMVADAVAKLPPALPGKDGKLPLVREWTDRVYYEGEVATRDGSTFQACRDTGRAPPHEDWVCIAAAGKPGVNARSPRVRETYSPDIKDYLELDIVALNGAAFIARRSAPGACPGEDWQMISMQGRPGKPGEARKGDPGKAGPKVDRLEVDDQGLLTLINADGSLVTCDLYQLLSKLQ